MATLSSRLTPLTVSVPAMSEWTSYTPTGPWTTNTTYTGRWRRVGDSIQIMVDMAFSGAPASGALQITPTQFLNGLGLTIDNAKVPNTTDALTACGTWSGLDSGVNAAFSGLVFYSGTQIELVYPTGTTTASNVTLTQPITWGNADNIAFTVTLPISGWTSHTASATSANAVVVGGQSVGSTMNFGSTSNQGFNILANNVAAIASTAAGALTLGLPSAIGGSTYAGQAIVGRTDGSAPSAGYVGQSVEGTQTTSTNFPTTGTYGDGTSVTLTSGRWLLSAVLDGSQNGATGTAMQCGIGTTTGNSGAGLTAGDTLLATAFPTANNNIGLSVPFVIKNITASTTYYLKVLASYSAGTPQYRCRLTAIRIA